MRDGAFIAYIYSDLGLVRPKQRYLEGNGVENVCLGFCILLM